MNVSGVSFGQNPIASVAKGAANLRPRSISTQSAKTLAENMEGFKKYIRTEDNKGAKALLKQLGISNNSELVSYFNRFRNAYQEEVRTLKGLKVSIAGSNVPPVTANTALPGQIINFNI